MAAPATIGRYRILAEIGRGGMGVVYRAHDPVIDREVALKTIRNVEGLSAEVFEELRQRFLLEARAAGRLTHPGIVSVLDAGTDEPTGVSFIAMELVRGRDLDTVLREGVRFTPAKAAQLVADVADALAAAHDQGIVHRDVKPANILLEADGRVKVTDFGIASVADVGLTRTGEVLGSPSYMSPEQISGRPVDRRSDVFSLGAVLYELLAGRRAFPGEGLSTLTYQIVHGTPEALGGLRPEIPDGYPQLVDRSLAKRPEDRLPDARSFAAELRGLAAGVPTAGPRVATVTDLAPAAAAGPTGTVIDTVAVAEPRRSRRPWIVTAGLALAVALGVAWWLAGDSGKAAATPASPRATTTPRASVRPPAAPTTTVAPAPPPARQAEPGPPGGKKRGGKKPHPHKGR
jgi:serine/threonine protein kinase